MTKQKWILIAVVAAAFTLAAVDRGRCDERKSQEDRVNKIVDAYKVENLAAKLMYFNYMHYYLDEMVNIHIDEPDIKVELAPTGAVIGLESMLKLFTMGDRAKVPYTGAVPGTGEMEIRGFGTPSEAMPTMGGPDRGEMHIHEMNGMVIEVAGDGQTAQIMFNSTGKENSDWAWIKYGIDCKKNEDGLWKIWHTHVYGTTNNSYFQDWADSKGYMNDPGMGMMMPGGGMPGGEAGGPGGMPPMSESMSTPSSRAAIGKWVYTGGTSETYSSIPPLYPVPPEPCETWDPEKSY